MRTSRPTFMWPVLIIGVGIVMLMLSADAIPEAYGDLLIRSWPVLLLLFGFNILLAGRLRYANWVVLGLSIALVVIIANFAYAQRRDEYRDDYTESWQGFMPIEVNELVVRIETKETRVTVSHAPSPRELRARFVGSTESEVEIQVVTDGTLATFTVTETRSGILPRLDEVGRGELNVFLPSAIEIQELVYLGDDGPVTFNLSQLLARRADIHIKDGKMKLCLPSPPIVLIGDLRLDNGSLQLIVPPAVALDLNIGDFDRVEYVPPGAEIDYLKLADGHLRTEGILSGQFSVVLGLQIDGSVILDHTSACIES